MVGLLVTVLVQSSSTSTSIIVSLVSSGCKYRCGDISSIFSLKYFLSFVSLFLYYC